MTEHDLIRQRLLAGVMDTPVADKTRGLETLREAEWSPELEGLVRARMVMGSYRYGPLRRANGRNYDRVGSAIKRLRAYQQTGNLEHLADVVGLMIAEFELGGHPLRHFSAADDAEHAELY